MNIKSIQAQPVPKRSTVAICAAIAGAFSLGAANVAHADELSDLRAQVEQLSKRLSDMEAKAAQQKQAAPQPAAQPVAQSVAVARPESLTKDQQGDAINDQNPEGLTIFDNGKTKLKIYGLVEATLSHVNNQAISPIPYGGGGAGSGGTSQLTIPGTYASTNGFQTAWFSGNRWGFEIDHDLGNGLKAISKLESEFELPSGAFDTSNTIFNRDAWLGLQSDTIGKLTFGRQNTLTRDFTQTWGDPYGTSEVTLKEGGYTNVNNFKQLIFYSGGPNGTRYNSAIEWKKKWGDHWVSGLAYKFGSGGNGGSGDVGSGGSVPGDFTNGTAEAASVAYNAIALGAATATVNLSYDRGKVNDNVSQSALLGGNVIFGPFRVNAGYIHFSAHQGVNNNMGTRTDNAYTVSGTYLLASKTEFALGYQQYKGSNAGFNGGGKIINPFGNT
ncbi:MAG: porin, partial [Burkholderiaceae bacterium]|nr:porin [Burkholderiaceae bacterium]